MTKTAMRDALTPDQVEDLRKKQVDGDHGPWAKADYLLAAVIDAVNILTYKVDGALGGTYKFEPVDRPFITKSKSGALDADQRAYLQRIREARGGAVE